MERDRYSARENRWEKGETIKDMLSVARREDAELWLDNLRCMAMDPAVCRTGVFNQKSKACLKLMGYHDRDLPIQKAGLLALAALCETQKLSQQLGSSGGVSVLVSTWGRFSTDDVLVKSAIVTMRSLSDFEGNRDVFCKSGGMSLLARSISHFSERASIQAAGAGLLTNLTFGNEERKRLAIEHDLIPLLIASLQRFTKTKNERVKVNICLVMQNLSACEEGCMQMKSEDIGLTAMLKLANDRCQSIRVITAALGTIQNVMDHGGISDLSKEILGTAMDVILEFIERTIDARMMDAFELAFSILRSIVVHYDSMENSKKCKILELSVLRLRESMENEGQESVVVVTNICACIRVMMRNEMSRVSFGTVPQGFQVLVGAVQFLSGRPLHLEHALIALGNSVFENSEGKETVRRLGGISLIHSILTRYPCMSHLAEAALLAIQAICSGSLINGEMASDIFMHELCIKVMRGLAENPVIQEQGLAAIVSFGGSDKAREQLKRTAAVRVAEQATQDFPFSKAIRAQEMVLRGIMSSHYVKDLERPVAKRTWNMKEKTKTVLRQLSRS